MPKPRTVAQAWGDYRLLVVSKTASAAQIKEIRRAFYAGAESLMVEILNGLSPGPDAKPSDEDFLNALHAELLAFASDVKKGLA
jgi:hypothetical protein